MSRGDIYTSQIFEIQNCIKNCILNCTLAFCVKDNHLEERKPFLPVQYFIYIYCSCDFSVDMLGRRKYAHVTQAMWHEIAFLHYEKGMSTKEITGWYNGVPSKATINRRLAEYRLQGGKYITVGQ